MKPLKSITAGQISRTADKQLCSTCIKLELTYLEMRTDLGTVKGIRARTSCPLCCFFARLLSQVPDVFGIQEAGTRRSQPLSETEHVMLDCPNVKQDNTIQLDIQGSVRARISAQVLDKPGERLVQPSSPVDVDESLTPVIMGQTLDHQVIRRWLDDCERSHGQCRASVLTHSNPTPITLVDVIYRSIVQRSTKDRFVALSYVLGDARTPRTAHYPSLAHCGALSQLMDQIPNVVRDAMELVSSLGERYLWVDFLCIPQDDAVQRQNALSQMDQIYSRASLTIVALSGNSAHSRLPGIHPDSRTLINLVQEIDTYWKLRLHASPPNLDEIAASSPYETRGWTFQERLLSTRCLYLTPWQAYFECQTSVRSESEQANTRQLDPGLLRLSAPLSDLMINQSPTEQPLLWKLGFVRYANLVRTYTQRHLSYRGDILNAFLGILRTLQRRSGTVFKCGLPEDALSVALLWVPSGPLSRRLPDNNTDRKHLLPSWSWAGWVGPVDYYSIMQYMEEEKWADWFETEISSLELQVSRELKQPIGLGEKRSRDRSYLDLHGHSTDTDAVELLPHLRNSLPPTLHFFANTAPVSSFTGHTYGTYGVDIPGTSLLDAAGRHCGTLFDYISVFPDSSDGSTKTTKIRKGGHNTRAAWRFLSEILRRSATSPKVGRREMEFIALSRIGFNRDQDASGYEFPVARERTRYLDILFDEKYYSRYPGLEGERKKDDRNQKGMVNVMLIEWFEAVAGEGDMKAEKTGRRERWAERVAVGQIHCDAWDDTRVEKKRKEICLR